ncbi:MAG: hypothetical protein OES38_12390, partial [Gammaproteobacteria bacterium]|nr:hypothetical protein [Gammaproteobacteria bacterium]
MKASFLVRATCAALAAHFASVVGSVAAFAVSAVLVPAVAAAAAPVEESVAVDQRAVTPAQNPQSYGGDPNAAASDSRRLSEIFYQLQVLQQEVQELRGTVEEQSHQLNRVARDQKEQYIDLDRRVAALRNNSAAPAISTSTSSAPGNVAVPATTAATGSERDAYTGAFNLMKNRQFEESTDAFNKLIVDYPNGQFTPNAFYWLGELYLAKSEHEKARQSFAQVTN